MAKKRKPAAPKKRAAAPQPQRPKEPPSGTPLTPSVDLAVIVGKAKITLQEANRKVWLHIKRKNLQDAQRKRIIDSTSDPDLKKIVGAKPLSLSVVTKRIRENLT